MSYRNSDGSITLKNICVTKATYQHIHDSVMSEYDPEDFIEEALPGKGHPTGGSEADTG